MPKKISEQELGAIAVIVADHPAGVQVGIIREGLDFDLPPRMLQRRLNLLAEQGRIVVSGTGKGTRYFPGTPSADRVKTTFAPPTVSSGIKLSREGGEIRKNISRPVSVRTPIGYQADFLDDYQPNVTAYLSLELRQQLLAIGQSGQAELPAGTYVRQVYNRLLIDLSWNSSRLEGNTYSLLETQLLLELGENAEGKDAEEAQMILNHKAAIEMLVNQADEIGFNRYTICNLHALLSDNLLVDPAACGRVRVKPVGISGTVFHPLEALQMIEERYLQVIAMADVIENAYEQSFFIMVHLPYLQPFEDVNKRVSRLAANIPLIRHNLCPLSFVDVSQKDYVNALIGVYELNRVEYLRDVYVWAYRRSCARYSAVRQSLGEPDPFRLRYRTLMAEIVAEIVHGGMDKKAAAAFIKLRATEGVPQGDQARFIEVVETEVMSLHEGNIARYRLRPSQYQTWKGTWR
ncbi:MAG TPA: Fic family protein [Gammaproteobacteria bacterium]|nr:Fic family protein [Gammaproteobacteria bacterium]